MADFWSIGKRIGMKIGQNVGHIIKEEYEQFTCEKKETKRYVVTITKSKSSGFGGGSCKICNKLINSGHDIGVLLCGHTFHYTCCISSGYIQCPVCEKDITHQLTPRTANLDPNNASP